MVLLLALLAGLAAGLRAMTVPAAVSWAAYLGWLNLGDSWLWWLGHWITPWILMGASSVASSSWQQHDQKL